MADTRTLLEAITDNGDSGRKITVAVSTRNEYETLRTRLVTLWSNQRDVILAIDEDDRLASLSLCSDYHSGNDSGEVHPGHPVSSATFWLGKSRRKQAKSYSFSIIPEPDTDAMSEEVPSLTDQEEPDETPPESHLPIKRATS